MKNKIVSFETFREIGDWEIDNLTQKEPSCFNGIVRVKKTRVTIEVTEETKEVYQQRLQKLWEESENHHDYYPIENESKSLGVKLTGSFGEKRKDSN